MAAKTMRVRIRRYLIALGVLAAIGIVGTTVAYRWLDRNVLETLPEDLGHFRTYRPPSNCIIYAADKTPIDQFYVERRQWVPIDELPKHVWQAFVASEDRRFFEHSGVDYIGIVRAFMNNLQAGGISQGGSTITQQIVKNLLVGRDRTYTRKLREAVLATRLENELSKKELLELYINYVYLGSGNYGVEAAARNYFGVSARGLDPGQAALLAGLVPAPSRYSPYRNAELATERRRVVLGRMLAEGYIGAQEAAEAARSQLGLAFAEEFRRDAGLGYITEVRREIRRHFGNSTAFEHGFHVYTAIDLEIQKVAEEALRDALHAVDERHGRAGVKRSLHSSEVPRFLERATGLKRDLKGQLLRPQSGDCFEAVVGRGGLGDMKAGRWVFGLRQEDDDILVYSPTGARRRLAAEARTGDTLRVCAITDEEVGLDQRPRAEGAVVVIENRTGRVVALVGGYEDGLEGFVRATQARRQPGSSFKPYVYATALDAGRTQLSKVVDGPLHLPGGNGTIWSPRNFGGKFRGAITLRYALSRSVNTVAIRLAMQTGPQGIVETAARMGVSSPLRPDLPLALGASEVTPMDQALGFATIARMGVPTDPVFIDFIKDARGEVVGRAGTDVVVRGERLGVLPGGPKPRALSAGVAYELADMMRLVVLEGTARSARDDRFDRAGKTGTTNDFVDAWFVGFSPAFTAAVWVGSDGSSTLGNKETGGRTALPAWKKVMEALPHVEGERFPIPEEAVLLKVGSEWLGFPRGGAPENILRVGEIGPEPLPPFPVPDGF
jgi:penicillin-binding protein 1A